MGPKKTGGSSKKRSKEDADDALLKQAMHDTKIAQEAESGATNAPKKISTDQAKKMERKAKESSAAKEAEEAAKWNEELEASLLERGVTVVNHTCGRDNFCLYGKQLMQANPEGSSDYLLGMILMKEFMAAGPGEPCGSCAFCMLFDQAGGWDSNPPSDQEDSDTVMMVKGHPQWFNEEDGAMRFYRNEEVGPLMVSRMYRKGPLLVDSAWAATMLNIKLRGKGATYAVRPMTKLVPDLPFGIDPCGKGLA